MVRAGVVLLAAIALVALAAPWLATNPPDRQHRDLVLAPPMRPHIVSDDGRWRRPFVYPLKLADRIERRYEEDRRRPTTLVFFGGGRLASPADAAVQWFPLGTDSLGRDVFARLLVAARLSLGVAAVSVLTALALGALIGGVAGLAGGTLDTVLMRVAELVVVLPGLYVVLALRAAMPLVVPAPLLFAMLVAVLALVGWPTVARGVRGIVSVESAREYVTAARAAGAGRWRLLTRHLLPASLPFVATQALILLPAFILAEATLSYVGLGFMPPTSSWGSMLQEAANVRAIAEFPWVLSPALAIAAVVFALNLVVEGARTRG